VDIARFEVQVKLSTTAFPPPIRAYDRSGREIPGVVVERVVTVLGSLTFWELVIHAPVVIYRLKIGSTNGLLYLDDLVY